MPFGRDTHFFFSAVWNWKKARRYRFPSCRCYRPPLRDCKADAPQFRLSPFSRYRFISRERLKFFFFNLSKTFNSAPSKQNSRQSFESNRRVEESGWYLFPTRDFPRHGCKWGEDRRRERRDSGLRCCPRRRLEEVAISAGRSRKGKEGGREAGRGSSGDHDDNDDDGDYEMTRERWGREAWQNGS